MRITQSALLDQADIARAVGMYVRRELNLSEDTQVHVDFLADGTASARVGDSAPTEKAPAKAETKTKEATKGVPVKEAAPEPETASAGEKQSLLDGPAQSEPEKETAGEQPSNMAGIFGKPKAEAKAGQPEQVGGAASEPDTAKPVFSFGGKK